MIGWIRQWYAHRQERKRQARWFADVIAGRHVHSEDCGGYLVPRCMQVAVLNSARAITVKQRLSQQQRNNLRKSWRSWRGA